MGHPNDAADRPNGPACTPEEQDAALAWCDSTAADLFEQ